MKQLSLLLIMLLAASCSRRPALQTISRADSIKTVVDNLAHRTSVEDFFKNDPGSPFHRDTTLTFSAIRWFPIDPRFRVFSPLHRYDPPETVTVMGTRGEQRRNLRYGYFEFVLPGEHGEAVRCRLNVYKFTPYDGQRYLLYRNNLSAWFTDRTTGKETYEVGRYLDVGVEVPDDRHTYEIDFNKAYNPYCAYSTLYSCAIPRMEDTLPVAITAGEKRYKGGRDE
jgi:uncharacterized protein (DUF1684 family)